MVRGWMIALGVGLLVLWLAGLAGAGWLLWLAFAVGVLSIVAGFWLPDSAPRYARGGVPGVFAAEMFVLWVVALATAQPPWQTWWIFIFGCAYLLLAAAGGAVRQPGGAEPTPA